MTVPSPMPNVGPSSAAWRRHSRPLVPAPARMSRPPSRRRAAMASIASAMAGSSGSECGRDRLLRPEHRFRDLLRAHGVEVNASGVLSGGRRPPNGHDTAPATAGLRSACDATWPPTSVDRALQSASKTTRSASRPTSIDPNSLSNPRRRAGFTVAARRAFSGDTPARTRLPTAASSGSSEPGDDAVTSPAHDAVRIDLGACQLEAAPGTMPSRPARRSPGSADRAT